MKSLKPFVLLSLVLGLFITGCSSPHVEFLSGEPYMVGDSNCLYASNVQYQNGRTCIKCYDGNKHFTGFRYPMSQAELQHYHFQKQLEAIENAQLQNSLYQQQMINQVQQANMLRMMSLF